MKTLVLAIVISIFIGIEVSSKPNSLNEAVGILNSIEESNGSVEDIVQGKGEMKTVGTSIKRTWL